MSTGPWFVAFVRNDEAMSRRKLLLSWSRRSFAQNRRLFSGHGRILQLFCLADYRFRPRPDPSTRNTHIYNDNHVRTYTTTYELPTYYVIDYRTVLLFHNKKRPRET